MRALVPAAVRSSVASPAATPSARALATETTRMLRLFLKCFFVLMVGVLFTGVKTAYASPIYTDITMPPQTPGESDVIQLDRYNLSFKFTGPTDNLWFHNNDPGIIITDLHVEFDWPRGITVNPDPDFPTIVDSSHEGDHYSYDFDALPGGHPYSSPFDLDFTDTLTTDFEGYFTYILPEPSTISLLGLGLMGLAALRRSRK